MFNDYIRFIGFDGRKGDAGFIPALNNFTGGSKMNLCIYGCGQEATHQFKNGKWCCSKNQVLCPAIRKIKSQNMLGKNSHRYGVKLSDETKRKISKSNSGNIVSKETRLKISNSLKGHKISAKNKELTRIRMLGNQYTLGFKHSNRTKNLIGELANSWKGGNLAWWKRELKNSYSSCCLCHSDYLLEMHHRDHNRDNNTRKNLIILCIHCHRFWHRK